MGEFVNPNAQKVSIGAVYNGKPYDVLCNAAGTLLTLEERSSTAATTTPTVGTSSTPVLAANASRLRAIISNPTGGTTAYLNFGAAATTGHHELKAADRYEITNYTGAINGIVGSGTQALAVTEFTA